jgi:hypothetical protein
MITGAFAATVFWIGLCYLSLICGRSFGLGWRRLRETLVDEQA